MDTLHCGQRTNIGLFSTQ